MVTPWSGQGLKASLEKQGFQIVAEASDARKNTAFGREVEPKVAIIDIHMPVLNGVDAARELKKSSPRTKVAVLTQDALAVPRVEFVEFPVNLG
jgi:YesN/AraC family two-component response regulator